ncbi:dihydrofolate reductase [Murinocardiopsis flavida]|uniref:Dihydrofolate reductase n=1 Tax=Murinocardiopsis flavida TaxID=645275 RepID=A0A2P8D8T4_9ACTN|nr:dihydrofolate reductase family protein [Murinocardiopsis flavida]PSK93619.1 dihydrofolate reductase [Murinocardiopsis flavida]
MRKLSYYIGTTIDGYIASPDDAIDFFPVGEDLLAHIIEEYPETLPTHVREQLGVAGAPNKHFDTMVQGRKTYDPALKIGITSPYRHFRQYVVSRSIAESPDPEIEIVADPVAKVRELKAEDGMGIYLGGGGELASALLPEIDELIVKVYPVVAGTGVRMFSGAFTPTPFTLTETKTFDSGVLIQKYTRGK